MRHPRSPDPFILTALAMIIIVTAGWWAAALWPLPVGTPDWVVRARAACFGSNVSGAPNSGGWILLIGTPLTMMGALLLIAPRETQRTLEALSGSRRGFLILGATATGLLALVVIAIGRVGEIYGLGLPETGRATATVVPSSGRRASQPAPPLDLLGQGGVPVALDGFVGRPVIVTFAYGKCETVCPVVVHNVLAARDQVAELEPVVLIVTLDPWRDTPARLPHIAASWGLPTGAHLLGGSIDQVEEALDAWGVERTRDSRTGDIAHAAIVYVIDRDGRIAFVTSGATEQVSEAVRRVGLTAEAEG